MISAWQGRWATAGALLASMAATPSARAESTVPRIPNLRAQRDPGSWVVEGSFGSVDVAATPPALDIGEAHWTLSVAAHVPKRATDVRLSTTSEGVVLRKSSAAHGGLAHGTFDVAAPTLCSVERPVEPVEVGVSYRLEGSVVDERVTVDYRCFLGRLVRSPDGAAFAELARQAMHDPSIERAVEAAGEAHGDAHAEVEALWRWLDKRVRYESDPYDFDNGWKPGHAYALEPTDTLRLGGDCEDWAILAAAFLASRGVDVAIAETPSHVWVRAYDGREEIDVDLTGATREAPPQHLARVSPSAPSSTAVALRIP